MQSAEYNTQNNTHSLLKYEGLSLLFRRTQAITFIISIRWML